MKKTVSLLITILSFALLSAENEQIGTSGFSFLNRVISAKYSSMGGAFTGYAADGSAILVNPASLAYLEEMSISTNYVNYFDGFNGGSIFLKLPSKVISEIISEKIGFGFGVQYLGKFNIPKTDIYGNNLGNFSASNYMISTGAGMYVNEHIDLGFNIKYLNESLDGRNASAISADIALMHQTTNENIVLGVRLKNLGTQLSYYTESEYEENFPITGTAGLCYDIQGKTFVTLDLEKQFDDDNIYWTIGIDHLLNDIFSLRTGFKLNNKDWKTRGNDTFSGFSAGFGIVWQSYTINYGIESFGDLGFVNIVGINYNF